MTATPWSVSRAHAVRAELIRVKLRVRIWSKVPNEAAPGGGHRGKGDYSMIKTILVAAAGTTQTKAALDTAIILARSFEAHVECLRVHSDPAQMLAQAAGADMGTSMVVADMWQALQDDDQKRTKAARDVFDDVCLREKVGLLDRPGAAPALSASWREETGDEAAILVRRARFNDLVVVEHPAGGGGFTPNGGGTVVQGSGRPVLIAPPESPKRLPRTIAVAWKDTPEAARAVMAAMPLLAKAERIVLVSVNEDGAAAAPLRLSLQNATDHLRWHGFTVEARYVEGGGKNGPDALLASLADAKVDALVMGGYGHSRFREFIFGGFTRRVLTGVTLPVFLFH